MFIPITHTTVINKTILYSDTVLSLKDIGDNIKITSIEDVNEFSLESCLKTIFESNPNVIFNTIQYSKNDKKVYFYTNQEITVKEFEESKYTKHKPINSSSQILEEVKKLLTTNKIKNNDCISLYDVAALMHQMNYKYESIKDSYDRHIDNLITQEFDSSTSIVIYDFDYDNKELSIGFNYVGDNYDEITFIKKQGDLYISKSESSWDKDVIAAIGTELSQLYDEFIKFSNYKDEKNYDVKPVNSNFFVDISSYGVDIFTKSITNQFMKEFKLSSHSYDDKYAYHCNSTAIIGSLKGNEDEIFKKIFVKISDCPKWSQETLYEIRQKQLKKEQKIEDEIKYEEIKKQRRLELKRKIFPFLNK